MFVLDDRSTRGAPSDPRPTLHHRARSRGGRHGHRVPRTRPEARPPRRAQGAETRARRAARRRAVPERNPGHRTPAAPAHPAALRLWPSRRPHLLRDAARGRRIAAPAAGTGEAAAGGDGDRDHSRGRECPRLRPPPRRDPPRHQAREHPVPGRTGGRRRFRDRARAERGGGPAPDGDGPSLGTPQYMSPEQATGDRALDARSDIYSLAAVLYEMLAGEPPHTGPTVQSVIAKVLTDRPRPLRALRDAVPPPLESAVQKALAKVPADRFASAAQLAEALTHPPPTAVLEFVTTAQR